MDDFQSPVDIANRALQHLGAARIDPVLGFSEPSTNASECAFAYNKLRKAELQRNTWEFTTRKAILRPIDTNTMLLVPTLWTSTATFFVGSIVSDENNTLWESNYPNNLGNDPQNSYTWNEYAGPLTVSKYDSSKSYFSGELVYTAPGDGSYNVYRSLVSANAVDPSLPNAWNQFTTYFRNQVVRTFPAWSSVTSYVQGDTILFTDGNVYASLVNANLNFPPTSNPTRWVLVPTLTLVSQPVPSTSIITPPQSSPVIEWNSSTTYVLGSIVMFNGIEYVSILANNTNQYPNAVASTFWKPLAGGITYMSLIDLNINQPPATSPLAWATVFVQGPGNSQWLLIGGAAFPAGVGLTTLNLAYPISAGPLSQSTARNVYRLPANFLRPASPDPKAGSASWLGSPTNLLYDDWILEGDYFTSRQTDPIMFRFLADSIDVRKFQALFCEMLAARIAYEICERITQSSDKKKVIISVYQEHRSAAVMANFIITGSTEQPLDDYLATRL